MCKNRISNLSFSRILSLTLVIVLMFSLLAGCSKKVSFNTTLFALEEQREEVEIVEAYLNGEISADDAYYKISSIGSSIRDILDSNDESSFMFDVYYEFWYDHVVVWEYFLDSGYYDYDSDEIDSLKKGLTRHTREIAAKNYWLAAIF